MSERVDYRNYIASPAWQAKKGEWLASGRAQECFVCGDPGIDGKDFHHLTYARLGAEDLDDIAPVCRGCHALVHVVNDLFPKLTVAKATGMVRDSATVARADRLAKLKETG